MLQNSRTYHVSNHFNELAAYLSLAKLSSFGHATDHAFEFFDPENGDKVLKLGLPLNRTRPHHDEDFTNYWQRSSAIDGPYWVLLLQAGEAALGRIHQHELLQYKVIRKYMVRKKQGKAQISHLKTKGKSRAGSRIRLAQTESFFNDINTKLIEWQQFEEPSLVVVAASPTLRHLWQEAKVPLPFQFDDERLRKANWTVGLPRQNELIKSIWHINSGRLSIFEARFETELAEFIG